MLSPLTNIDKINGRQDAIEDLIKFQYETDVFRTKMSRVGDVEKMLAKCYTYSVKQRVNAIYFENVSVNKLKEFRTLLRIFKSIPELVRNFT